MKKIHYTDIELWLSDYAEFEDFIGLGDERVFDLAGELRKRDRYAEANKLLKANGLQQGPCSAKEVAHEGNPCPHCLTPQRRAARFSELVRIVDELDKTADGVPITPKTELWQAHPWVNHSLSGVAHPWPCSQGYSWQRNLDKPVYSTEEAARESEL